MRILALDLGSVTGVTYGVVGEIPATTVWRMPKGDAYEVGRFLASFEDKLDRALAAGVDLLALEAYVPNSNFGQNNKNTDRRLGPMAGICEKQAFRAGIEVAEEYVGTIRKDFCGNGRAKKPEVMATAKLRGFFPHTHDEADSIAVWWYAAKTYRPALAVRYDPLFKNEGARRALF